MSPDAQRLLDEARKLPAEEKDWLTEQLLNLANERAFSAIEAEYGKPEPEDEALFRANVEEALADDGSGDIPHEEAMKQFHEAIQKAREMKKPA
jgi:hypothetical protein